MGFDIKGDRFIVTGAAKGIGLEISRKLSDLGAKVSGWDLNYEAMASEPAFTHKVKVDVTNEKSIKSAVKESIQKVIYPKVARGDGIVEFK